MLSTEGRPLRLAVTGREGQVVRSLLERGRSADIEVVALGRPDLDLSRPETIAPALRDAAPDAVLNAAAYTAVDKAESEPALAFAVNADGAGAVAQAAAAMRVPLLHLSTDYVFDGVRPTPYVEDAETGPIGVYGRSKLAGEQAVKAAGPDHVILRTAWVYSPFGSNFVRTMLRLATTRDEISVVADQHGCPTNALDLADAISRVVRNLVSRPDDASLRGVFHVAGTGETTWADFARAIFAASSQFGGPVAAVKPIPTVDYPTPARRPANSRLDLSRLAERHGVVMPRWETSLPPCVARVLETMKA